MEKTCKNEKNKYNISHILTTKEILISKKKETTNKTILHNEPTPQ